MTKDEARKELARVDKIYRSMFHLHSEASKRHLKGEITSEQYMKVRKGYDKAQKDWEIADANLRDAKNPPRGPRKSKQGEFKWL